MQLIRPTSLLSLMLTISAVASSVAALRCFAGQEDGAERVTCAWFNNGCYTLNCSGSVYRGCDSGFIIKGCLSAKAEAYVCSGEYSCCHQDFCNAPNNIIS